MKIAVQDGERFNTFSHLIAAMAAVCGVGLLLLIAMSKHDMTRVITCMIYGASTVGIYAISTLYHATQGPKKIFLRRLDHIGIYFKIAGNFTPYMILAIQGRIGWTILATVWILAIVGIFIEIYIQPKTRLVPNLIYFTMCCTLLPIINVLAHSVPLYGFGLIMLGFLSLAIGFYFFQNDEKILHGHGIWHMFVIGGSVCHYLCLLLYVV